MKHPIIPDAALSQHIAVLGKSGSGKTYAAKAVIVEPLLAAGKRIAIVDPTSAWWGLRTSADGTGPGFEVLVLGGDHGDLPLPVYGGEAVARLIVEQGVNLVADTGNLTVGERTRWMIDFAGTLYRLNRAPLHLVLDEAHVFAPQGKVPDPDTGRMLHAVNQIGAGGRSRGIRLTMLTQRPQKLHKDLLTTADTLIAMRVLAPHDRDAVKAWVDGCGNPAQGREVLDSLAQLQRGEGWVWYPEGGVLHKVKFPPITTFDSSATPKDGDEPIEPRGAAEIDLGEIRAALADAAAEAEENDPKLLKARIAELEREKGKPGGALDVDRLIQQAREHGEFDGYAQALEDLGPALERITTLRVTLAQQVELLAVQMTLLREKHAGLRDNNAEVTAKPAKIIPEIIPKASPTPSARQSSQFQKPAVKHSDQFAKTRPSASAVDKPMPRAVLTALAQHPRGLTKGQVLVHTGYRSSGATSRCFADLLAAGWIEGRGVISITPAGTAALGPFTPLPVGAELRKSLLNGNDLAPMEKRILGALFDAYPKLAAKGSILTTTGYASSGATSRAFARLTALGYATKVGRGQLRASADLY